LERAFVHSSNAQRSIFYDYARQRWVAAFRAETTLSHPCELLTPSGRRARNKFWKRITAHDDPTAAMGFCGNLVVDLENSLLWPKEFPVADN
jgi:hypothetical protein